MKNRNTKEELELDIEFIDATLNYLNEHDYVSVERMLTDWKDELKLIMLKKTNKV